MTTFDLTNAPDTAIPTDYVPRVAEGKVCCLIVDAEDMFDYVKLTCEVVAHEDEASIGQRITDRLDTVGSYVHRGLLLAEACGILSEDTVKRALATKTSTKIEPSDFITRAFCSTVKHRKGRKGTFANLSWTFLSLAEGKKQGFPVDEELLGEDVAF